MHRRFMALAAAALALTLAFSGCGKKSEGGIAAKAVKRGAVDSAEAQFAAPAEGDPIAIFDTTAGEVRAVLYSDKAPQACANFTGLAQNGYYNGTSFYRVEADFCAEGGLAADGTSSTLWGTEGFAPETTDALHHYSGALCAPVDSTGVCRSAFYFLATPPKAPADELLNQMTSAGWRQEVIDAYKAAGGAPYLDYTDTVFGQVYSGMDVVDTIAQAQTDDSGKPAQDILINSVTIDTYHAAS